VAWAGLCLLLALGSLAAAALPAGLLDWQVQRAWREPWRWWSAAFVHLSPRHLTVNLAGCAVVAGFGWAARLGPRWTWAWVAAWPLVHLALLEVPGLARYAGLSGLLHAGVAVAALGAVCGQRGRRRSIGCAALAGLAAKVLLERPWLGAVQHWPGWDIAIVPAAHAAGAAAGLACALVACATSRLQGLGDTGVR
jgi:rhomboid family GlyGly-CTERM serine protease